MPVFLECQRCTPCCRWPGQVRLTDGEITGIAAHLGMQKADFINRLTRLDSDRRGLALLDKPNGECSFLDGELCSIQPVKLRQCRDFSNLRTHPGSEKSCRAVLVRVGEDEYRRLVSQAPGRSLPDDFPIPQHAHDQP